MIDLTQCVVGVDLGDQKSLACVYSQGAIVEWFEFAMTPDGVRAAFEGKGYLRVALEAGAQSGWVTRLHPDRGADDLSAPAPGALPAVATTTSATSHAVEAGSTAACGAHNSRGRVEG